MWKKEDERRPPLPNNPQRTDPEPPAAGPHPPAERAASRASIGPSIEIRGELTGDEDLTIEGRVEGKIDLKEHGVTIGPQGQVRAEVHGRMIVVEGEVEGNLTAEEQILIRRSGRVRGDLAAPRVHLEDGAHFKGAIDMEPHRPQPPRPAAATAGAIPAKPPAGVPTSPAKPAPHSSWRNSARRVSYYWFIC